MTNYAALLRGVNVGGRTIKMAELKACFEGMGFADVATVLQSGNVLFSADGAVEEIKCTIEDGLGVTFGYPAKVLLVDIESLRKIVAADPFDSNADYHHYALFFESGLERELAAEATGLDPAIDSIQAGDGVLYWRVPKGQTLKSVFAKYLTKAKYKNFHTNRNINTLRKLIT